MFKSKQSQALTQQDIKFIELKNYYESLNEKTSFVTLITSSFPTQKQITDLINEHKETRYYDIFQQKTLLNNNTDNDNQTNHENNEKKVWYCFSCSNPDKALDLLKEKTLIQGQLKEKHGKWKFLRRWRKRIYSITSGNIVYFKKDMVFKKKLKFY